MGVESKFKLEGNKVMFIGPMTTHLEKGIHPQWTIKNMMNLTAIDLGFTRFDASQCFAIFDKC